MLASTSISLTWPASVTRGWPFLFADGFIRRQSKGDTYGEDKMLQAIRRLSKVLAYGYAVYLWLCVSDPREKALVKAGVGRLQVMEQLGISKASYYRCFVGCAS